jgi:hypothetical protein
LARPRFLVLPPDGDENCLDPQQPFQKPSQAFSFMARSVTTSLSSIATMGRQLIFSMSRNRQVLAKNGRCGP